MPTIFQIAEREDVNGEEVFEFSLAHFATIYDHATPKDWEEYTKGGPVPRYVKAMIGYPRNTH